jgi:hypothetical protein
MGLSEMANAETKRLVCENSGEKFMTRMLEMYEVNCEKKIQSSCEQVIETKQDIQTCRSSGVRWSHHKEFLFDSDSLHSEKARAEYFTKVCWGQTTDVERILVTSTPSVISFAKSGSSMFNVDRKTLRAGFNTDRDYQCRLVKPDTAGNKI